MDNQSRPLGTGDNSSVQSGRPIGSGEERIEGSETREPVRRPPITVPNSNSQVITSAGIDRRANEVDSSPRERPNRRHSQKSNPTHHLFWLAATIALFFSAWFLGPTLIERYQYAATKGRIQAQYENAVNSLKNEPLTNLSRAYQLVAQKIHPSVVSVTTEKFGEEAGEPGATRIAGEGSGVVLTADGYILTNHHVVENSRRINVALSDRRMYEAQVVGSDVLTDLAVIKIKADDLIPAEWANSDDVEVGTLVWAVGNPYGLKQTITSGILSAKDRRGDSSQYQEFLQTDAAVNPGNSGGPLVDSCGRVIGINTSIYGRRFQGISFAVPSVLAQFVYKEICKHGKVERGFLGVTPGIVYQHHAEMLDLEDLDGALIREVVANTPADDAGLEAGDVIRSWNGHQVKNWRHLYRYVAMTKPNLSVDVELVRGGVRRQLNVKVGESRSLPF